MVKRIILLGLLISFFIHGNVFGQRKFSDKVFAAVDMRHTCLGNKNYEIALDVYTECGLSGGILENQDFFLVTVASRSLNRSFLDTVRKSNNNIVERNGQTIKLICQSQNSQCELSSYNANRAVKKYTYKGQVNLAGKPEAEDWTVIWDQNSRSEELNTIASNQPAYTETIINTKAGCNTSPTFDSPSIIRVCSGEDEVFSLKPTDVNGDNLRFTIVAPKVRTDEELSYLSGYSPTKPINGNTLSIDPTSGDIIISSTAGQSNGMLDILVEELKGSKVIGISRKSLQIVSIDCNNLKPDIIGFTEDDDYEITICANESLNETNSRLTAIDPDSNKMRFLSNPRITWAPGMLPQAIFRKNTIDGDPNNIYKHDAAAYFQWTPRPTDIGQVIVTVEVEDNECPEQVRTQDIIINVNPIPTVDIGQSKVFDCNNPFTINPEVTYEGTSDLLYYWGHPGTVTDTMVIPSRTYYGIKDTISTAKTFRVDKSIELGLFVSDEAGCSGFDTVFYRNSIDPYFGKRKYCEGLTTEFWDTSMYVQSTFLSRKWIIETPTSTEEFSDSNIFYTFPSSGDDYMVSLIVENSLGCIDTLKDTLEVFKHPQQKSRIYGLCERYDNWMDDYKVEPRFVNDTLDGTDFYDLTNYEKEGDPLDSIYWVIRSAQNPSVVIDRILKYYDRYAPLPRWIPSTPNEIDFPMPDSGKFYIDMITITEAGCKDTLVDSVTLRPRPQLFLVPDANGRSGSFPFNCSQPDTILKAYINPLEGGTGTLEYYWFEPDSTAHYEGVVNAGDTLQFPASEVGVYRFGIIDELGCDHFLPVERDTLIDAVVRFNQACKFSDTIFFDDSYSASPYGLKKSMWYLGNGDSLENKVNTLIPYVYPQQGIYQVVLTYEDNAGCKDADTLMLYHTFPNKPFDDKIVIDPSFVSRRQCVTDTIHTTGFAFETAATRRYLVDRINWSFTFYDKVESDYVDSVNRSYNFIDGSPGAVLGPNVAGQKVTYIYGANDFNSFSDRLPDSISIQQVIAYNTYPNILVPSYPALDAVTCFDTLRFFDTVTIYPQFDGNIFDNRVCIGDSGLFEFQRTINKDIPLAKADWKLFEANNNGTIKKLIKGFEGLEPTLFIDDSIFRVAGNYFVTANFTDTNGCQIFKQKSISVDSVTATPALLFENTCSDKPAAITLTATPGSATYWVIKQNFVTTLDSGKFDSPSLTNPVIGTSTYTFNEIGEIPLSVFIVKDINSTTGAQCRGRFDTIITIFDIPRTRFEFTEGCSGVDPIIFTNTTQIDTANGTIISYTWDFGDGTKTKTDPDQRTISHLYKEGGSYSVNLSATTQEKCFGSFDTTVYVKYTPKIGYYTNPDRTIAGEDITFYDDSERGGKDIDVSKWTFENIGEFLEENPTVQWTDVRKYEVYHSILTEEGCFADSIFIIDLNPYFDVPSAFSPNNDGINDNVGLIFYNIEELLEFKIFNRWGEVVFDGENNLNARWDGKYKGTDQEVGAYVVHAKALDAYNNEHNIKKNLRLIR